MKRNDVQKLKILLFILACLVPVLVYAAMFGTNNFNWLSIPNPHELYLESYDTSASQYVNFAVHSSTDSDCTMDYCWAVRNVSLKNGQNVFREPLDNCSGSFRVTLDCGQSIVSFRCNKTSEGRSSYNASLAATANTVKTGRAYPISLLAVLLLSIALVSLVINPSMGSSLSLLILFTLSSSLLVMQFHLTSLGLNEWIIPLACAVAWVSIWKKMQ